MGWVSGKGRPLRAKFVAISSYAIGYGFGIITGLKKARGNFLGWTHSDSENNLNDIIRSIEIFEKKNADIFVKGLRKGKRPIIDLIFSL